MRLAEVPILINQQSYQVYKQINKDAQLIPAFIPPVSEPPLSDDVKSLISECQKRGMPIVSTNASKTGIDKYRNDIYGIDFLVDYFSAHDGFTLLVSDPKGGYKEKLGGGSEKIVFIDKPHSYFELLKYVDIFVRNTSTDGDALSVKEALYLNKPALCSDVVDRPVGTILFEYSNEVSFAQALENAKTFSGKNDEKRDYIDVVGELIKIYLSLGISSLS